MPCVRWMCCSVKKSVYVLLGFTFITCNLIIYYKDSSSFISTKIYQISSWNTSLLSVYLSDSNDLLMTDVSKPSNETDVSLFTNVTCKTHQRRFNWTACPGCLRPVVPNIIKNVYEVGLEESFLTNKSTEYFTPRTEIVEHLNTEYLIVPRFNSSNYYLLAIQPSILDRQYERDVVRNTWASVVREQKWPNRKINANVKVVFVVSRQSTAGDSDNNSNVTRQQFEKVKSEADTHNDILYIDMIDNYYNLTLKLLSAFKWVKDNCPCVKFVLKVDYDTFVNVPLLVDTLLYFEDRFENSILGMVYTSTKVKRWGKWGVPISQYPFDTYTSYASGCGYVMSYKVLSQIVNISPYVPMFSMEDAFITGVLRRIIGCRMFSFQGLFTHYAERYWYRCLMLQDQKILGTSKNGGNRHYMVWNYFGKGWCK